MSNRAKDLIEWYGYGSDDGIVVFEEPSYDTAFIGLIEQGGEFQSVYDYDLMIDYLTKDENYSMSEEEAADFISYNSSFSQAGYPLILYRLE